MNLKQLISITPMAEDYKKEISAKLDNLSADQIYELTDLCWSAISEAKKDELIYAREKYMTDISLGKKKYNAKDLDEIETKVDYKWSEKLEESEVLETIAGFKNQTLDTYKTQPMTQDKMASPQPSSGQALKP